MTKFCPECDYEMADDEDNCERCEQINDEIISLTKMVDRFAERMKKKLVEKAQAGWGGWDCDNYQSVLKERLIAHATTAIVYDDSEQWLDVANFAAFLDYAATDQTDQETP